MTANINTLVSDMYSVIEGNGGWDEYMSHSFGEAMGRAASNRFSSPPRNNNTLRMSNMGKPCTRQLYYDVNADHSEKEELKPWTLFKFFYGDMIEEAALSIARAAGHKVQGEQEEVELQGIKGHYDGIIDGMLVDVKSCSPYAFKKFNYNGVKEDDPFGYISQLSSYLYCLQDDERVTYKDKAGFLAIDKVNGHICLDVYDLTEEMVGKEAEFASKKNLVIKADPPNRSFSDVEDGKNRKLDTQCSYCGWKETCWPNLRTFLYSGGPRYLTQVNKLPRNHKGPIQEVV